MSEQPSRANRTRFVTLCQQMLAMATVVAVLTPAARTITMDVRPVPTDVATGRTAPRGADMAAYVLAAQTPSRVPAAPVDPTADTYALTAPRGARVAPGALRVASRRASGRGSEIVSQVVPVTGYGAVGITWQHGASLPESAVQVEARTRTAGRWSGWSVVEYHDDHGPDAGSAEARRERPGTEALFVGRVDAVQARVRTTVAAPADMRLSVIDPGTARRTALERPALDTAALDGTAGDEQALLRKQPAGPSGDAGSELALASTSYTPKPKIYSRAQWGANESWRDRSSLHYGEVHAGFIHHTVQANDYTRADVPGLIRADYYYHVKVRGWSDIGYNYLVDKFGRIWEGRYGGVDRDPVGAHTLGYNDDSFAASAIGNFDVHQPSAAMVQAYAALFAWKLSLAGVRATATHQWVTKKYFNAINGHRDAGQTACPGRYLYAKIPAIRTMAANIQVGWAGRQLHSDIAGTKGPDLIVRRASDGMGFILPITVDPDGVPHRGPAISTGVNLAGYSAVLKIGDWDGDGHGDMVARSRTNPQNLWLYRGLGTGRFAGRVLLSDDFRGVQMLTAVGDWNGDGRPDIIGQPSGGSLTLYPGRAGRIGTGYSLGAHLTSVRRTMGIGRWNGDDGAPDLLYRTSGSRITAYLGDGPGLIAGTRALTTDVSAYNLMTSLGSANGDGHADVVARDASGALWVLPGTTGSAFRSRIPLGSAKDYDLIS